MKSILVFLLFLVSCGETKRVSPLDVMCLKLVDDTESYIENAPKIFKGKSPVRAHISDGLTNITDVARQLNEKLFECQASLLEFKSDNRERVLFMHQKTLSLISVINVYKKKLYDVDDEDLSAFQDRLIKNIEFIN